MATREGVNWQQISQLPLIGGMIRDMLAGAKEQYESLVLCRPKPHVLDDHLIGRVLKLFREQKENLRPYEEQLVWWNNEKLTAWQRREVDALAGELKQAAEMIDAVLALAEELSEGTIDVVMAKSDLQLGVEAILGSPSRSERAELKAALTAEQLEAAALIDSKVQALTSQGSDDLAIFVAMGDLMPSFKPLLGLATAQPDTFDSLCRQFPGMYVYAKILESIAGGLASGVIDVPR
jgi:hypothetical protein